MKPAILCIFDDDIYAALDLGWPDSRVLINPDEPVPYSNWCMSPGSDREPVVIITDSNWPEAVDYAEQIAASLRDVFPIVRVLALPGGLAGWTKRGGDAARI